MISRMRNIVQHNLPAKILTLVIAVILLGLRVMNDQNPSIENTYTVQLDVVNAPEGYKITKDASNVKSVCAPALALRLGERERLQGVRRLLLAKGGGGQARRQGADCPVSRLLELVEESGIP